MRLSPGEVTGRETYPQVNSGFARCYGLSFSLSLFLLLPFRVNYYFFNYLFVYFWLCSVFVAMWAFSTVSWTVLGCGAGASYCDDFSWCEAQAVGAQAPVVAACGLRSCGTWA